MLSLNLIERGEKMANSIVELKLTDEMENIIKQEVYELVMNTISEVKRDSNISKVWVKKGECAKIFGVSFVTFSKWVAQYGAPSHVIDGVMLFNTQEISEWLINFGKN